MIQRQWTELGVECRLEHLEWNVVSERFAEGEFQTLLYGLQMPLRSDPFPYLHSSSVVNGFNHGAFVDDEIDCALLRLRAASSTLERCAVLQEIQRLCLEKQPNTYLYDRDRYMGISRRLKNVSVDVRGRFARVLEWELER